MTLTEFLLARIAEDEAAARDAGERRGLPYESPLYVVDDNYRHDQVGIYPERVLAECEAKRRIVGIHELDPIEVYSWGTTGGGCGLCDHSCETGGDTWGHDPCDAHDGATFETVDCETLQVLALPYADHPDYRQEWKP